MLTKVNIKTDYQRQVLALIYKRFIDKFGLEHTINKINSGILKKAAHRKVCQL